MLGIEKFMFGVDFPMWEHDKELERFYGLRLSDSDNEKILYQNALRFLSLTGGNVWQNEYISLLSNSENDIKPKANMPRQIAV